MKQNFTKTIAHMKRNNKQKIGVLTIKIIKDIGRSIVIQSNIKLGVNRLNPVQKATYFLKKSKVGKNKECIATVKTATDQ